MLYQAPISLPMMMRPQFDRFFKELLRQELPPTPKEIQLAESLTMHHRDDNPFDKQLSYSFASLRKGLACPSCNGGMMVRNGARTVICQRCRFILLNEKALRYNIGQLRQLFPGIPIHTASVSEWIGHELSPYMIRKTLKGL